MSARSDLWKAIALYGFAREYATEESGALCNAKKAVNEALQAYVNSELADEREEYADLHSRYMEATARIVELEKEVAHLHGVIDGAPEAVAEAAS